MLKLGQRTYPILKRVKYNQNGFSLDLNNFDTKELGIKPQRRSYSTTSKEEVDKTQDYTGVNISSYPPGKFNMIANVCPKGHLMMVERFGKLHSVKSPGLFFAIPFIDRIRYNLDMREMTLTVRPQSGVTQDNVKVTAGGSLYVRIVDEEKACYAVRRVLVAVEQLAMSSMRTAIGKVDLDKMFHDRSSINEKIKRDMNITEEKWGIVVERYELTTINADKKVEEAMDLQSVAERDRRKEVLNAQAAKTAMIERSEGERQHYINIAEGKKAQALLEAEAQKQTILLEAQAKKEAIEMVAETLTTPEGRRAQDFLLAKEYLGTIANVLPASNMNTVFLPQNLGDIPKMMGTAMGILDNNNVSSKNIRTEQTSNKD